MPDTGRRALYYANRHVCAIVCHDPNGTWACSRFAYGNQMDMTPHALVTQAMNAARAWVTAIVTH